MIKECSGFARCLECGGCCFHGDCELGPCTCDDCDCQACVDEYRTEVTLDEFLED